MGQEEVVKFLEKCDKPKTRKEIADGIGYDPNQVSHLLKKLVKCGDIKYIEYDRNKSSKNVSYLLLRRTKFYFIKT